MRFIQYFARKATIARPMPQLPDDLSPAAKSDRAAARLARAGWTLGATAAVLVVFAALGRVQPLEAALAFVLIGVVTAVAPRRRSFAAPARRAAPAVEAVSPQSLTLLSGLPDPTVVLDRRGVTLAFNAHAQAALPAIRAGDPISFAVRAPEVLEAVKAAAKTRRPQVVAYAERVPVERWIEAHVASAGGADGAPSAIVVAFRDLTEQRRSERMRADFVANASHELRTPLASLLGFVETLQGPAKNDAAAREKFLAIMRAQANRMSRLIDDLLSLSRIELKAHVRPRDVVDVVAVARNVIDALSPLAEERGVEVALLADGPALATGDRDELTRVVENLVENAIKYGDDGKRVEVTIATAGEGVRLAVRDYGPGIAPEHLPRLTERFYRPDVSHSREKGGTGLGLALVKHVLQRHGGQLAIESELGAGATFTVTIPAAVPAPATPALAKAS
ncbi:two-component system phosphate regulon sensor histidine kinase PhoR [Methylopila capsulata]|uniref:histidine kinase n=2 Tax=Methylopila capsulata TaxID=61654 RepID=A0A9W6ITF4_9HYPH|nr:ATP-binding protein [Methylopila capsulata]MBM7851979.1 two-component system phosphate regulon sensor histidine kinase PhoR [Methylopila capsulata]GLK55044.1 two-component sensor histidine kinase [Methylopila capsulata]